MPAEIWMAATAAEKTDAAIAQIYALRQRSPLARIWVLVATRRQESAFRQQLIERLSDTRTIFNLEFFDFYTLYSRLLDAASEPQRGISDTARLRLLRHVLLGMVGQGSLSHFAPVAETPGFVRLMADFIFELKQNRIDPDEFIAATAGAPAHLAELARIFKRYQDYLTDHQLADKEGQGWLAVDRLAEDRAGRLAGDLALLVVHGFDQFTPVQAELLAQLARRSGQTFITLTIASGREAVAGRRFQRALERLESRFAASDTPLIKTQAQKDETPLDRSPDLVHLTEEIFRSTPRTTARKGQVTLIEVPSTSEEVRAVLRDVKRLLLQGVSAEDITIAVRDWTRYRVHFTVYAQRYGLPLALHFGTPLTENPAIDLLIRLLNLHMADFPQRDLLAALRSPYLQVTDLDEDAIHHLDAVSRMYNIIGGRELWLETLEALPQRPPVPDEDEPTGAEDDNAAHGVDHRTLASALQAFMDAVTPPEEGSVASLVGWLADLIGADPVEDLDVRDDDTQADVPDHGNPVVALLPMLRHEGMPEDLQARDLTAMQALKRLLQGVIASEALLAATRGDAEPVVAWSRFWTDLLREMAVTAVDRSPERFGQVLVTSAADARGLPIQHLFVLGLSEGAFPAPMGEDPLLLDGERLALRQRGLPLETRAERRADDSLFYELIGSTTASLTLTRPTIDDGQPWLPSRLWQAVLALFTDGVAHAVERRMVPGGVVPLADAAAPDELAVALADHFGSSSASTDPQAAWVALRWLHDTHPVFWRHLAHNLTIERERLLSRRISPYVGVLHDRALRDHVGQVLGDQKRWSASQFNELASCGFRFFAHRLLRLEPWEDPVEGMDARQRGSLIHGVLEAVYRQLGSEDVRISPDNLGRALAVLDEVAAEVFAAAPETFSFRQSPLWQQEQNALHHQIAQLIRRDFAGGIDNPISKNLSSGERRPYRLEVPFGLHGATAVSIPLDDSTSVRVTGIIDRLDRVGNSVIVIDYKSGSTRIPLAELQEGRNFQMMAYVLAARQILDRDPAPDAPDTVVGGLFWHTSTGEASGVLHLAHSDGQDAMRSARAHLTRLIEQARDADFLVEPRKLESGQCSRNCDYAQLCRVAVTRRGRRKIGGDDA